MRLLVVPPGTDPMRMMPIATRGSSVNALTYENAMSG
jgi:hypothetical protein